MCTDNVIESLKNELLDFASRHPYIVLYGAGDYGKSYYNFFREHGIKISSFVQSQNDTCSEYKGTPIVSIADLSYPAALTGIILSLEDRWHRSIKEKLQERGYMHIFSTDQRLSMNLFMHALNFSYDETTALNRMFPLSKIVCAETWEKILIVRLDAIGDMILTIPFFRELRREFAHSTIDLVMRRNAYTLLENCPYLDNVFVFDGRLSGEYDKKKAMSEAINFVKNNLNTKYDVVFLPRSSKDVVGAIYVALASCAPVRIGFSGACAFPHVDDDECIDNLFSLVIHDSENKVHEVERTFEMLRKIGICSENDSLELFINKDEHEFARRWFAEHNISNTDVCIAVAVNGNAQVKSWDINKFHKVIEVMLTKNRLVKFILFGDTKDIAYSSSAVRGLSLQRCFNIAGSTSLRQATALMKECKFYFGCDTGLKHIAAAVGLPVIELSAGIHENNEPLCDWSASRYGAWGVPRIVLEPEKGVDDCKGYCHHKYAHCINAISVEDAIQSIESFITRFCG